MFSVFMVGVVVVCVFVILMCCVEICFRFVCMVLCLGSLWFGD